MARLPIVDGDVGQWGTVLNGFLQVAHNSDGTLQTSAIQQAGGVTSINAITPTSGNVLLTAATIGAYTKPGSGIPSSDLDSATQTALSAAVSAYQKPGSGIPASDLSTSVQTGLTSA